MESSIHQPDIAGTHIGHSGPKIFLRNKWEMENGKIYKETWWVLRKMEQMEKKWNLIFPSQEKLAQNHFFYIPQPFFFKFFNHFSSTIF